MMARGSKLTILDGLALVVIAAAMALAGCGDDSRPADGEPLEPLEPAEPVEPLEPLEPEERQALEHAAAELEGRSFRQFEPSVDAARRKRVILDFHDGIRVWAQYAEDGYAIDEWEIRADSYRVESTADGSGVVLIPEDVTSEREFPDRCSDCIPATGVSVSIRDVLDSDRIAFRIDDPDNVLPSPFPVFDSWTRFSEDEIFE